MEHVTVKFPEMREVMIDNYSYDTIVKAVKKQNSHLRSLLISSG